VASRDRREREEQLYRYVAYRCVIGCSADGLATDGSDTDRRGFYLPPARLQWSLRGVPDAIERLPTREFYWELETFIRLALEANPTVLECLYSPRVEYATPIAEELLAERQRLLSREVARTHNAYVAAEFRKLERVRRGGRNVRWRSVMQLIRMLLGGIHLLREGARSLDVSEHRDRLLAIGAGETPWAEIDSWRRRLHDEFRQAAEGSPLPERPDYAAADALLIRARRAMVDVK